MKKVLEWFRNSKAGLVILLIVFSVLAILLISQQNTKIVIGIVDKTKKDLVKDSVKYKQNASLTRKYISSFKKDSLLSDSLKIELYYNKADSVKREYVKKIDSIKVLEEKLGVKK